MHENAYTGWATADDPRLAALGELLRGRGLSGVMADAAGARSEIATLTAPAHLAAEIAGRAAELIGEIKALGFHYVALDLTTAEVFD